MTTEVLRNMIYAGSPALDDLGLVVLDEVHFLQDTYRGPVWEEVIVHLPAARPAGVPVGDGEQHRPSWRRGSRPCAARRRRSSSCAGPVRLDDRYLVGDRTNDRLHFLPTFVGGRPEPRRRRLDASAVRRGRLRRRRPAAGQRPAGALHAGPGRDDRAARRSATCCRRSSSSSAATSATRRPARASPPACG